MLELKTRFADGDVIADHYRILGVAGAGGMGVVYRAEDIHLQRAVAIKILPSGQNPRDEERFLREARTACSLDHQNIGVIYEVGMSGSGTHFIAMAFYEGASLAERLNPGPMPPTLALDLMIQAAEGLREAHHHGIVHRDIKPSNLMVTNSNVVKIVDFGLAQAASAATATFTGTTGTVAYMSPEQARGERLDARTDIFSLYDLWQLAPSYPWSGDMNGLSVCSAYLAYGNPPPETWQGQWISPSLITQALSSAFLT